MTYKAAEYNPRKITPEALTGLRRSIEVFGDLSGVVVNQRTGNIVCGHQRNEALAGIEFNHVKWSKARKVTLGPPLETFESTESHASLELPNGALLRLRRVDWEENFEKAANIAANNPHLQGTWNEGLEALLAQVGELGLPDDLAFDALLEVCEGMENEEPEGSDVDAEPQVSRADELRETWGVEEGQLWSLGNHKIICGCSTLTGNLNMLFGSMKADMVLTDPPYGVSYVGKTKDALTIENDDIDEGSLSKLTQTVFDGAQEFSRSGAYWYATVPPGPLHSVFLNDWKRRGILRQVLVWLKDSMVLGHSEYHYRHEPILFGWVPGGERHKNSDRTRTSVWECDRPKASREHPTMKPVELWVRAIKDGSRKGECVYDPFSGSGTTIMACEQTGRHARVAELDPKFVAVALQRWAEATGGTPTKA